MESKWSWSASATLIARAASVGLVVVALAAQADESQFLPGAVCAPVGTDSQFRVSRDATVYNPSTTQSKLVICPLPGEHSHAYFIDVEAYLYKATKAATRCYLVMREVDNSFGFNYPQSVSGAGNKTVKWDHIYESRPMLSVMCQLRAGASATNNDAVNGLHFQTYTDIFDD